MVKLVLVHNGERHEAEVEDEVLNFDNNGILEYTEGAFELAVPKNYVVEKTDEGILVHTEAVYG